MAQAESELHGWRLPEAARLQQPLFCWLVCLDRWIRQPSSRSIALLAALQVAALPLGLPL